MPPAPGTRPQKLDSLTSLRFFAAACIVVQHLAGHFGMPVDMAMQDKLPWYQGVSFFFVLSGFIMTMVYPKLDDWPHRTRFLIARFARVWPGHLLAFFFWAWVMTGCFGLQWGSLFSGESLGPVIANIAMVHAWIPTDAFYTSGNPVSWTISTEFGFYLLFFLLLPGIGRWWPVKLLACLGIAIALIYYSADMPYASPEGTRVQTFNGWLYMNPLARVFEFCFGMATFVLWQKYGDRLRFGTALATVMEIAALGAVVLFAAMTVPIRDGIVELFNLPVVATYWLKAGPIPAPAFAFLVFVMALQQGWISRVLTGKAFVFLGEISYSIYLLHFALISYFYAKKDHFAEWPQWSAMLLYFGTLILLSALVWRFFEMPARKAIVRVARKLPVYTKRA